VEPERELAHENWSEYFDAVSKELPGAVISIEITDPPNPPLIEAGSLALHALAYDRRDDVFEVAATKASPSPQVPSVVRRLVDQPERVVVDSRTLLAPMTIAVDGRDGVRTVIKIEREADLTG
jgi:hypothetical protein